MMRNTKQRWWSCVAGSPPRIVLFFVGAATLPLLADNGFATTRWDSQALAPGGGPAGSGTQWWFDPLNWSPQAPGGATPYYLPPMDGPGGSPTPAEIDAGTTTLPGGEGVVYDPENDVYRGSAGSLPYAMGYGPESIYRLNISRNTATHNLLTINGHLEIQDVAIVGYSGSSVAAQNEGRVVQLGGAVSVKDLQIGNRELASGWGNGVYDYRGGTLDVSASAGAIGIKLSYGNATNGTGGTGRFIVHNPLSGGHVRTYDMSIAADGNNGDGVLTGVGIVEFHVENGRTRPIQVYHNLSINNGLTSPDSGGAGIRSSRLELALDEAPLTNGNGVPVNLGLFDVNFEGNFAGVIVGTGDLNGDGNYINDRVFSRPDGVLAYRQGDVVSATYGSTSYHWTISYTGSISWSDAANSVVAAVSGTGGVDVVLVGQSSVTLAVLRGDYNNDHEVNAADYTVWRDHFGAAAGTLPNDVDGGVIGQAQYLTWKSNFGAVPTGAGAVGSALPPSLVPEPPSGWLLSWAVVSMLFRITGRWDLRSS
jgi:hypothetical protein